MKYLRIYLMMAKYSIQTFFVSRLGAVLFLSGKVLRFLFFFSFIMIIFSRSNALSGYNFWQVALFYMTFNFIDSATQMLFREVYRFRYYIISGNFDMLLLKPINVLFRSLFGWTDILDLITLVPFIVFIIFILSKIPMISVISVLSYVFLVINSLIIASSFHIAVLSLAVLTTEIDHAILIYRDITSMGRVPIDVYTEPLRGIITFVIPVGIMMAFPAKAVMGLLSGYFVLYATMFSLFFLFAGLKFWQYALKHYTSASS